MAQTVKNPPAGAQETEETTVLVPGSGSPPGEGKGNPLQCSGLEDRLDRGAWWATVHGVAKNQTGLSD